MTTKVFSKIYVGVQVDKKLGFMTPYEENKAFEKRKQTIEQWLNGHGKWVKTDEVMPNGYNKSVFVKGEVERHTLDNVALEGFTITDNIKRRYWGGGNVVFRVMDPRGFELEIPSQNLMMLINDTTIVNGVIQGKCIWGRDGSVNVLLHESSEEYKNAIKNAETMQKRKPLPLSSLVPGKVYLNSQGEEIVYLGSKKMTRFFAAYDGRGYDNKTGQILKKISESPRTEPKTYHFWARVILIGGSTPRHATTQYYTGTSSSIAYGEPDEPKSYDLEELWKRDHKLWFNNHLDYTPEQENWRKLVRSQSYFQYIYEEHEEVV